ncbi:MAG: AI-2E family transporter [Bacteroidota bacterium]
MKGLNVAGWLIVTGLVITLLVVASNLLIPFVIALVVVFLIQSLQELIASVRIGTWGLPAWLSFLLAILSIVGFLGVVGTMISSTINAMSASAEQYALNAETVVDRLLKPFGFDAASIDVDQYLGDLDFGSMVGGVLNMISSVASNFFLILIYVGFLLLEARIIDRKWRGLFTSKEEYDRSQLILGRINSAIKTYISVKTLTSVVTGVMSYIVLLIVGVDFAPFWAFLIFLLNYIPTIGSLIATIFPALLAVVQFPTLGPAIVTLGGVSAVQIVVGNIMEPRMMGSSLNISPFIVILSLSVWGVLWGVAGMVLCVPITVIMMIIFAQFPGTKRIAILLSEDGEVNDLSYRTFEDIKPRNVESSDQLYQRG